mgnify:CR=1 FL=1|tara:strand:- start:594 stop:1919 length:1326 start_codon:yes stop_codon:yes gene_type:complete
MSAVDPSIYEEIIIESADGLRTVDVAAGTVMIDYYEDILSPTVTVKLQIVNDGGTIEGPDGKLQTVYNGLPLRGGERVKLKITGNTKTNPGLDFASQEDKYLFVSSITNVLSKTESESFTLNLVSREALTNETTRVGRKFPTSLKISESVKKIIKGKKYLSTNKSIQIDETQNKYGFVGNMRKPFTVLTWLASKSVPGKSKKSSGTAGYFFYETRTGYKFRSIDNMISGEPFNETYRFSEVVQKGPGTDYKIIHYSTNQNQDLLGNLQRGAYCSQRIFFNPYTFEYTDPAKGLFKLEDYRKNTENLGKDITLPRINPDDDKTIGDIPSRNVTAVLDVGTMEKDASIDSKNADPGKTQSQAMMRYNTLFTQLISMTIPSNTNLEAGTIIECSFPRITRGEKKDDDPEQSGLYMIKELCHHYDPNGSYTSLKLISDTFGSKPA